jgi:catechol 2,3-dioxygenase-like lactoylglutathione lyase family enzyme
MIIRLHAVVLDCPQPRRLADFYSELTGWKTEDEDDDWITLRGDGDVRLSFQLAPDHQPPQWPDPAHPQQFHLDLHVDDMDAAERRALELGARALKTPDGVTSYRVFADPAGHPFCLCIDT